MQTNDNRQRNSHDWSPLLVGTQHSAAFDQNGEREIKVECNARSKQERKRERGTWRKRWRIFLWAVRKSRPKLRAKRGEFSSSRRFWRVCEPRTIGVQGIYWRRRLSTCWTRSKRREGGVETGRGSQRPACAPFCTRRVGEEDEPSADETLRLRGKAACPRAHTHTPTTHRTQTAQEETCAARLVSTQTLDENQTDKK